MNQKLKPEPEPEPEQSDLNSTSHDELDECLSDREVLIDDLLDEFEVITSLGSVKRKLTKINKSHGTDKF